MFEVCQVYQIILQNSTIILNSLKMALISLRNNQVEYIILIQVREYYQEMFLLYFSSPEITLS